MNDTLRQLLDVSVLVFAISSMLSVGLGHTVREVIGPLLRTRAVVRALVANFLLIPVLGFLVVNVLPIREAHEVGLFLLASAAGAPFLIKLVQAAAGDMRLCVALVMLLLASTIIYMPIVVPRVLPEADVSATAIAMPLILTMLVPLGVGLSVRHRLEGWAVRIQPPMNLVSTVAIVVLILTTVLKRRARPRHFTAKHRRRNGGRHTGRGRPGHGGHGDRNLTCRLRHTLSGRHMASQAFSNREVA